MVVTERLAGWEISPQRTVQAESVEELCETVRGARAAGTMLLPVGHGLSLSAGGRPAPAESVLDMRRLSRVVRVIPGDLTVTVQAGASLAELRETLREVGLQLPGANAQSGTIGGLLASGYTTPEAGLLHGSLRERVLGLAVVDGSGVLSRSGGSVVKNVTGYDLHRVHAGPGGALGILVEITFRLEPMPERRACLRGVFDSLQAADGAWRDLRLLGPDPAAVVIAPSSPSGSSQAPLCLDVHLAGDHEVVESDARWLCEQLGLELLPEESEGGVDLELSGGDPESWQVAVRTASAQWSESVMALQELCGPSGPAALRWQALPELGAVRAAVPPADAERAWRGVAQAAKRGRWQYRVEGEPAGPPSAHPAWSARPEALRLLRRWKEAADPAGILHPGSYSVEALERSAAYFESAPFAEAAP